MTQDFFCEGIEAAKRAEQQGASRIFLCSNLSEGGITPPYPDILEALQLKVPVCVLIRPRTGDYVYSTSEGEKMMHEIAFCGSIGIDGVAIGALDSKCNIDLPLCADMVSMARSYGLNITFNRAIDEAIKNLPPGQNQVEELFSRVFSLGVDRILTGSVFHEPEETYLHQRSSQSK